MMYNTAPNKFFPVKDPIPPGDDPYDFRGMYKEFWRGVYPRINSLMPGLSPESQDEFGYFNGWTDRQGNRLSEFLDVPTADENGKYDKPVRGLTTEGAFPIPDGGWRQERALNPDNSLENIWKILEDNLRNQYTVRY